MKLPKQLNPNWAQLRQKLGYGSEQSSKKPTTESQVSILGVHQSVSTERPLRQFVSGKDKTAGRNSAGRITIWHRGGGAKRSQRTIDLKRNTSSVGVVERIEYDPNRSSRIAVVRWVEGAEFDRQKKVNMVDDYAPTRKFLPTMTVKGQFSFSSLPGMMENRNMAHSSPKSDHVVVGLPKGVNLGSNSPLTSQFTTTRTQMTNVKDIFLSAFSKVKGDNAPYTFISSTGIPRMAIAGAKPDFFVPRIKDDVKENKNLGLDEIKKWDKDSIVWGHKMKRKAAVSWQGLVGVAESKLKSKEREKRDEKFTDDRARVTYILATHQMEAGKMVMNCDSTKRSNDRLLDRY